MPRRVSPHRGQQRPLPVWNYKGRPEEADDIDLREREEVQVTKQDQLEAIRQEKEKKRRRRAQADASLTRNPPERTASQKEEDDRQHRREIEKLDSKSWKKMKEAYLYLGAVAVGLALLVIFCIMLMKFIKRKRIRLAIAAAARRADMESPTKPSTATPPAFGYLAAPGVQPVGFLQPGPSPPAYEDAGPFQSNHLPSPADDEKSPHLPSDIPPPKV